MRAPANPSISHLGRLVITCAVALSAAAIPTIPAVADEPTGALVSELAAVDEAGVPEFEAAPQGVDAAAVLDDGAASGEGASADGTPTLASYLSSGMLRVSADVALVDGDDEAVEPVVGSFTVDGLTYAIVGEGEVALVAVSPRTLAGGLVGGSAGSSSGADGAEGPDADSDAGSDASGAGEPAVLTLPEVISYDGSDYSLTAIGPRALAGCDAATVVVPASVASVDQAAFEGSSVASVEVADGNPDLSSYDGMLFDAEQTSLLLVPEGKQGAARVPSTAEVVDPSRFSHSAGVDAIDVEAGSAAYSSRNGCLYDASGETLLRVPAGATDIQIADGCATVAAGSMEGCASLATIHAPASVVEVSSSVGGVGSESRADGSFGEVPKLGSIRVYADGALEPWESTGLEVGSASDVGSAAADRASVRPHVTVYSSSGAFYRSIDTSCVYDKWSNQEVFTSHAPGIDIRYKDPNALGLFYMRDGYLNIHAKKVLEDGSSYMSTYKYYHNNGGSADGGAISACISFLDADGEIVRSGELKSGFAWSPDLTNVTEVIIIIGANAPRAIDLKGGTKSAAVTWDWADQNLDSFSNRMVAPTKAGCTFAGWRITTTVTDNRVRALKKIFWVNQNKLSQSDWPDYAGKKIPLTWTAIWKVPIEIWDGAGTTKIASATVTHFPASDEGTPLGLPSKDAVKTYFRAGYKAKGYKTYKKDKFEHTYTFGQQDPEILDAEYPEGRKLLIYEEPITYKVKTCSKTGGDQGTITLTYDYVEPEPHKNLKGMLPNLTGLYNDGKSKYDYGAAVTKGYTAVGWSTKKNSSKADYEFGLTKPNLSTTQDEVVTIYLAEEKNEATFDPNGGVARVYDSDVQDEETGTTTGKYVANWDWKPKTYAQETAVWPEGGAISWNRDYGTSRIFQKVEATRTGYRPNGFKATDKDGKEFSATSGNLVRGATYQVQWEPIECAVTLDPNGGSGGTASVRATYDQVLPAASMPVRPGFKFEGYYDSPTGGTCYYRSDGQPVTAWDKDQDKCTLYAFWTEGSFAAGTTTIDVNGYDRAASSFIDRDLTDIDGVARLSHYDLKGHPEWLEDYALRGHFTDPTWAASRLEGGMNVARMPWPSATTYHLVYAGRFRSSYILAGNAATGASMPVDIASIGWARDPEGRTRLPEGYALTEDEGTIYAIWPSYAARLDPRGGSGEPQVQGTVGKVLPTIPAEELPTMPGYSFDGYWIDNMPARHYSHLQCWVADPGNPDAGAIRVYDAEGVSSYVWDFSWGAGFNAHWAANAYRVTFDPAGGAWGDAGAGEAASAAFDQDVTLAAAPKRAGYVFAGWEVTGPDGAAYSFDAGATLAGGKLKAAEGDASAVPISYGERAVEGQEPATTATFTAKWVADLRVDVPISVDLDLTVDWEQGRVVASGPDGSEHATGEFRSWSSGEVQVAAFGQEAATAMGHRQSALGLFASGDEAKAENLSKVSLALSADADGAQALSFPLSGLYELPADRPPHDAMASPQDLSSLDLVVPPASSAASPGTLRVRYGIDCAADLPLSDVAIDDRPRPILRLVYRVGLANP